MCVTLRGNQDDILPITVSPIGMIITNICLCQCNYRVAMAINLVTPPMELIGDLYDFRGTPKF